MHNIFPILKWFPQVKHTWKADLIAGLTVTIIAIPQAVAFALIAGLPPVYGLYSAIIIPFITAIFGTSNQLISGPTTSVSILVFATISQSLDLDINSISYQEAFIGLALVLSFMAGFIQLLMGIFRLASIVNFVSHSVIVGFAAGAGILIAVKQLHFVFGLAIPKGSSFIAVLQYISSHFTDINWNVFAVAIFTLISAILFKKIQLTSKIYMLLALVLGSLLAYFFGMNAVGITTVGKIPSGLPSFKFPNFSFETIKLLASGAVVLALLGTVEAVAIAKSISLKTHQKINPNQEFIAQGIANMMASMFSAYAGSGSFTRSAVNYQAGAKTPFASLLNALFLILLLLFGTKFTEYLPQATMGGIILLIGYNLIDFPHIKRIFKSSYKEAIVFLATFISTLALSLELALLVGVVVSLLFYLHKTSNVNIKSIAMTSQKKFVNTERKVDYNICPQLNIIRIDGSIYFGTIEKLSNFFINLFKQENKNILIVAPGINFIDLAGAEWLCYEMKKFEKAGGKIVVVGAKLRSQEILKNGG
ncbi:MAG: SulP family inorganic anion transporter, partial [Polaribacter sp.]